MVQGHEDAHGRNRYCASVAFWSLRNAWVKAGSGAPSMAPYGTAGIVFPPHAQNLQSC